MLVPPADVDTLKKKLYNLGEMKEFTHDQLTHLATSIPPPRLVTCAEVICPGICAVHTYHSQEVVRYGAHTYRGNGSSASSRY